MNGFKGHKKKKVQIQRPFPIMYVLIYCCFRICDGRFLLIFLVFLLFLQKNMMNRTFVVFDG